MKKARARRRNVESKEIRALRKEVEALMASGKMKQISKAFKHTLAQRLGVKELKEGGLSLEANAPVKLREIIKQTGDFDIANLADHMDDPYSYYNIYRYSFW